MGKTEEEIRNMSEDELWEYVDSLASKQQIHESTTPLHFNTKEEWNNYFSDGINVDEFDRIIREKYGM